MIEYNVNVGLLGCGNVGAALAQLIEAQGDAIAARTGIRLNLAKVAVRSRSRDRGVAFTDGVLTTNPADVIDNADIDVIVEVMGGIEPARELITKALNSGKPVVTANKELLANFGAELYAIADSAGLDLLFEAAVAGGIPLMRPLRESLVGEPIHRVMGIVNGTTNFILSSMTNSGESYSDALSEAQALGFAERDPTADVEGYDAGAKAAIIASIAFGAKVVAGDVYHEGISEITAADIAVARRMGFVVKLLAICEQDATTRDISVRVHPALVPTEHPLANVSGSYNAVFIEGGAVGSLMLYGRGAGGMPTASAVLGDLIDAASNLSRGTHGAIGTFAKATIKPIDDTSSEYSLTLDVVDLPGVLHAVTGAFAAHGVSIRTAEQDGLGDDARLVFITHIARESDVQATLAALRKLDVVKRVGSVLRVIGGV